VKPVRSAALLSSPRPSLRRGHPSESSPRPQPHRVTAAPCPLDIPGAAAARTVPVFGLRRIQVVPSPPRRPVSPGPCSVNESVAMSTRLRRHRPILPWASLAPANPAATCIRSLRRHPPRVAGRRTEVRMTHAAARPRRLRFFMCTFAHAALPGPKLDREARFRRGRPRSPRHSRGPRPKSKPAALGLFRPKVEPARRDACPGASTRVDPACG
jgi:hypothetical protein